MKRTAEGFWWLYVFGRERGYVCVCVHMYEYVCVYVQVNVARVRVCAHVPYMYVCTYKWTYARVRACVCLCVCLWVWLHYVSCSGSSGPDCTLPDTRIWCYLENSHFLHLKEEGILFLLPPKENHTFPKTFDGFSLRRTVEYFFFSPWLDCYESLNCVCILIHKLCKGRNTING